MCSTKLESFGFLTVCFVTAGLCQDFAYDGNEGPDYWGHKYHSCVGKHQSPIDIEEHDVETVNLWPMKFENFDRKPELMQMENNGHTVALTLQTKSKPQISGGPLVGKYGFQQLHFHWGSNDEEGSETRINNNSFPMELHMVFYRTAYGSYQEATEHPDGLVVLSFLYSSSDDLNENYVSLLEALPDVQEPKTKTALHNTMPLDDLLIKDRSVYFTYGGSLTTPPCSEIVTWIEFKNTIPLAHKQIDMFRHLNGEKGLLSHNFRPTQPLHGRIIRMNVPQDEQREVPEDNLKTDEQQIDVQPNRSKANYLHFSIILTVCTSLVSYYY